MSGAEDPSSRNPVCPAIVMNLEHGRMGVTQQCEYDLFGFLMVDGLEVCGRLEATITAILTIEY